MDPIIKFVLYFLFFLYYTQHSCYGSRQEYGRKVAWKSLAVLQAAIFFGSIPLFAPAFMIWIIYSNSTPVIYAIPHNLYPVVILLRLGAIGIFGYAMLQIDVLEFSGLKRQRKNILVTGRAYGIVRQSLYTAGILLLITNMQMTLLDLTAVLLVTGYLLIGAFIEERRLLSVFGDEYRKYKEEVSMFIPVKWFMKKLLKI